MAIDTSIADLRWLYPESPSVALGRGAEVGGMIAANRARRAALMEERRQFDLKMQVEREAQVGGLIAQNRARHQALEEEQRQFNLKMQVEREAQQQTMQAMGQLVERLSQTPKTADQIDVVNQFSGLAATPEGARAVGLVGQMLQRKAALEIATSRAAAAAARTSAQSQKNKANWDAYSKLPANLRDILDAANDTGVTIDQRGTKVPLYTTDGNWTGVGSMWLNSVAEKAGVQKVEEQAVAAERVMGQPAPSGLEPSSVSRSSSGTVTATFARPKPEPAAKPHALQSKLDAAVSKFEAAKAREDALAKNRTVGLSDPMRIDARADVAAAHAELNSLRSRMGLEAVAAPPARRVKVVATDPKTGKLVEGTVEESELPTLSKEWQIAP